MRATVVRSYVGLTKWARKRVTLPPFSIENGRSLKLLEEFLVAKAVVGELTFAHASSITMMSTDDHYFCHEADIRIRIDDSGNGTYSFIWVAGVDLSYQLSDKFDYDRVISTCIHGKDPGETRSFSLWHC